MAIPAPKDQWYVVHVLSGQEQKVRNAIARRIPLEDMTDHVFDVLVTFWSLITSWSTSAGISFVTPTA
jgi:hypothetical protein